MIVTVYAIAKNEAAMCGRFMDSAKDADHVVVLDTGSTDGTSELLRKLGAEVTVKEISPWRFDVARNESMKLIPDDTDICVCVDLDEAFESGWRAKLEAAWRPDTTRARYTYVWNYLPDGREGTTFLCEKIHAPGLYRWKGPVHETLEPVEGSAFQERWIAVPEIKLCHRAAQKATRSDYLPLLKLAVEEEPQNDRYAHYYGRELMYHGMWHDAIGALKRHLALPTAAWDAERAASMRYIARCYIALSEGDLAELWLTRAIAEAPRYREGYVELERLMFQREHWKGCVFWGSAALSVTKRELTYITDPVCWGALPHDLMSVALFKLGDIGGALRESRIALELEPENERIRANVETIRAIAESMEAKRNG